MSSGLRTRLPCASRESATALPFTTSTPRSRSPLYSASSGWLSGSMRLRTLPSGLSTHSAVYMMGPRWMATRPLSAATFEFATTRRIGIGRFSSMESPAFQVRQMAAYPFSMRTGTALPFTLRVGWAVILRGVLIEIGGYRLVTRPSGDADVNSQLASLIGSHRHLHRRHPTGSASAARSSRCGRYPS